MSIQSATWSEAASSWEHQAAKGSITTSFADDFLRRSNLNLSQLDLACAAAALDVLSTQGYEIGGETIVGSDGTWPAKKNELGRIVDITFKDYLQIELSSHRKVEKAASEIRMSPLKPQGYDALPQGISPSKVGKLMVLFWAKSTGFNCEDQTDSERRAILEALFKAGYKITDYTVKDLQGRTWPQLLSSTITSSNKLVYKSIDDYLQKNFLNLSRNAKAV
jgi:hypothetical protein